MTTTSVSGNIAALLAQIHNLLWIVIMWYPFVSTWFSYADTIYDWNQLTWWSWFVQTLFYTNMYVKTSIMLCKPRRYLKHKSQSICKTDTVCNCCFKCDFLFLGIALGISWFVFFMFGYVLFHNPNLVHIVAENSTNQAVTQLGNILVHYYTVSAIFIWTVFNHKYVEKTMIKTLRQQLRQKKQAFSSNRIFFSLGASAYWILVVLAI